MDESEFLIKFKSALIHQLPGESSHQKMSPIHRPLSSLALKTASNYRESAVAIVLFRNKNQIECILTQRPEYDGNHSGQMSFPGGKRDESDANLEATARRECFEEIGIPQSEGILLGELTEVFIPVSNFLVHPFVFFHQELPVLIRDEREVAEIVTFSLFDLKNEERISTMEIHLPNGTRFKDVPYFDLVDKKVWGATALILNEIRDLILMID